MSTTTTSAELSLINDTEFLEELEQFDGHSRSEPAPSFNPEPIYEDGYEALEGGLPIDPAAPVDGGTYFDREPPTENPYDEPFPLPPERRIPLLAAALVIAACLAAGAVTAAYVFQDGLTRITATPRASR
jgi:hypothetical protein